MVWQYCLEQPVVLLVTGGACQKKLFGGILISVFLILTWMRVPLSLLVTVAALRPQEPGLVYVSLDIHFYSVIM